ncbi:slipin family protein, partial [Streptomyces sp. SID1034]|nr:slipin family protein [Streptomyces sp. SID1034]
VEIGVDKNTTVVFPAPLMSTIGELGSFLAREASAAAQPVKTVDMHKNGPATLIPHRN